VGWLHEGLHALALRLVGRRALSRGIAHIDIPADLPRRQFVFVAGLPACVFGTVWGGAMLALLHADDWLTRLGALALAALSFFAVLGTIGDIQLIVLRLWDRGDS
jgi:hypothetical protein